VDITGNGGSLVVTVLSDRASTVAVRVVLVASSTGVAGGACIAGGAAAATSGVNIATHSAGVARAVSSVSAGTVAVGVVLEASGARSTVLSGIQVGGADGARRTTPLVAAGASTASVTVSGNGGGLRAAVGVDGAAQVAVGVLLESSSTGIARSAGKAGSAAASAATDQITRDRRGFSMAISNVSAGHGSAARVALVVGSAGLARGASVAGRTSAGASTHKVTGHSSGVTRAVRSDCACNGGAARVASVICGAGSALSAIEAGGTSTRAAVDQITRNGGGITVAVSGTGAGDRGAGRVAGVLGSAGVTGSASEAGRAGTGTAVDQVTRHAGGMGVTVSGNCACDGSAARVASVIRGTGTAQRTAEANCTGACAATH